VGKKRMVGKRTPMDLKRIKTERRNGVIFGLNKSLNPFTKGFPKH